MAYYRVQIALALDSALPEDAMCMTPHYQGDNPAALADALKVNLLAVPEIGATLPFKIKVYDAEKAPPSYPLAEVTSGTGFKVSGNSPREVALCLSYYSSFNRPRFRGRIYIPACLLGGASGLRPSGATITKALGYRTVFGAGLPSGTNWTVWSKTDKTGRTVTQAWVDDEWDIIRSRGLKGTTRQTAAVLPPP